MDSPHLASQDIDPEESISQIHSHFKSSSVVNSSRIMFLPTSFELDTFRSYFMAFVR